MQDLLECRRRLLRLTDPELQALLLAAQVGIWHMRELAMQRDFTPWGDAEPTPAYRLDHGAAVAEHAMRCLGFKVIP